MRLLICGDRHWTDAQVIRTLLVQLKPDVVIEGEAKGADSIARDEALRLGIQVLKFPALWDQHGKAAGPIRNQQMLDEGKPDLVAACHDDLSNSKGTADMVRRAKKAGVPVRLVSHNPPPPLPDNTGPAYRTIKEAKVTYCPLPGPTPNDPVRFTKVGVKVTMQDGTSWFYKPPRPRKAHVVGDPKPDWEADPKGSWTYTYESRTQEFWYSPWETKTVKQSYTPAALQAERPALFEVLELGVADAEAQDEAKRVA